MAGAVICAPSTTMTVTGPSLIRKHSATLHGHRTSFSLEDEFWVELKSIAAARKISLAALIAEVDDARSEGNNLSSALRLHVLSWLKASGPSSKNARH